MSCHVVVKEFESIMDVKKDVIYITVVVEDGVILVVDVKTFDYVMYNL